MSDQRRLCSEWESQEAEKAADSREMPTAGDRRKEEFRRTMQVLSRFESSFRRAAWKSGCEMAFPVLFGHLSFTSHRCWTVYMRKSIYLAAESWRQHYGQAAAQPCKNSIDKMEFNLPSGELVLLHGWRKESRQRISYSQSGDSSNYELLKSIKPGTF